MKISSFLPRVLAAIGAALGLQTSYATLPYAAGDLLLGVHAKAGSGAGNSFVINIGPVTNFAGAAQPLTVPGLGDLSADLSAQFGPDWKTRADVAWGIFGVARTATPADPADTIYVSRPETVTGTFAVPWRGDSPSGQRATTSKINAVVGAYIAATANGSSTNGVRQDSSVNNSYHSSQPAPSTGRISFQNFAPTIEGDFSESNGGTAGSIIDLFKIVPVFNQPAERLGFFQLNDDGGLTFTPATFSTVRIKNATYAADEDDGTIDFAIARGGNPAGVVTVNFATSAGSAVAGEDFTSVTTTVTFQENETTRTVSVPVISRPAFYQGDKTFTVTISAPSNGATLAPFTSATATIGETDPAPPGELGFVASSFPVSPVDGAGNPNSYTVNIVRANGSAGEATANLSFSGTLVNGTHYQAIADPTTVTFADGETSQPVTINLNAAAGSVSPGTIVLTLSDFTGAAQGAITSTTLNVAPIGIFTFSSPTYQGAEGGGADTLSTITVNRTGGATGAVSVEVLAAGVTADGNDFSVPASPVVLSWPAGDNTPRSFDVTIKSDALAESAETVSLTLQNATGGAVISSDNTATLTILDIDTTQPTVTLNSPKPKAKLTGNGGIGVGTGITFTGNARDNLGIARVEVKFNGVLAGTATPTTLTTNYDWSVAVVPEQGVNAVEIVAVDLAGNASTFATTITFTNLRPELAGTYSGLVVAEPGSTAPLETNGLVTVKVSKTGTFTGKVFIGGTALPIGGVIGSFGPARFGKAGAATVELITKGKTPVALGQLDLTLTADLLLPPRLVGTLKKNAGATTVAAIPGAFLSSFSKTSPPPSSVLNPQLEKGKYTAVFQADPTNPGATDSYPQGDGFGTLSVSTSGVVKLVGKLADGTAVSFSNTLSLNRQWPLFVQLYTKKGFIGGLVTFDDGQPQTDASGPDLLWFKPAALPKQKFYPNGWPTPIKVDFAASKFVPPGVNNAGTVLGDEVPGAPSPATANIVVTVTDGGLASAVSTDASLSVKGAVTPIGATNGLKAKFVNKIGALSGSFTHPGATKAVAFSGVAYQKTNTAAGYFLFTPSAGATGAVAASGAVGVVEK